MTNFSFSFIKCVPRAAYMVSQFAADACLLTSDDATASAHERRLLPAEMLLAATDECALRGNDARRIAMIKFNIQKMFAIFLYSRPRMGHTRASSFGLF